MRAVKTDGLLPVGADERAALSELCVELIEVECLTEDALINACAGAEALLVVREPITARVIGTLDRCKVISRFGVGLDTIDVPAATAAGIAVCNVPDANIKEVSEHAFAMILHLIRRLGRFDKDLRAGHWRALEVGAGIKRTEDMILGLVGFGQIGQLVARKAFSFGFRVIVHDPYVSNALLSAAGATRVDLDRLLAESDVITLHVPLTKETRGMIDRHAISTMKLGAILINVSRGALVDEAAVAEALIAGHLAGAGIDTFAREPPSDDNPLLLAPNVVLTPHAASCSEKAIAECVAKAFANVIAVLSGERPLYRVN